MQRVSVKSLAANRTSTPPPLRVQEPEVMEESAMELSGQDAAPALLDTQQLWVPTHDRAGQHLSGEGGGPQKPHS